MGSWGFLGHIVDTQPKLIDEEGQVDFPGSEWEHGVLKDEKEGI